jgi:hypothetical protein
MSNPEKKNQSDTIMALCSVDCGFTRQKEVFILALGRADRNSKISVLKVRVNKRAGHINNIQNRSFEISIVFPALFFANIKDGP